MSEEEVKSYTPRKGQGCGNCSDTGFRGRVAMYEVMVMTDQLKEFVLNGASGAEIKREVADLSLAVAEKVVGSSMDAGTQRALVDRYIEELGGAEA